MAHEHNQPYLRVCMYVCMYKHINNRIGLHVNSQLSTGCLCIVNFTNGQFACDKNTNLQYLCTYESLYTRVGVCMSVTYTNLYAIYQHACVINVRGRMYVCMCGRSH